MERWWEIVIVSGLSSLLPTLREARRFGEHGEQGEDVCQNIDFSLGLRTCNFTSLTVQANIITGQPNVISITNLRCDPDGLLSVFRELLHRSRSSTSTVHLGVPELFSKSTTKWRPTEAVRNCFRTRATKEVRSLVRISQKMIVRNAVASRMVVHSFVVVPCMGPKACST